MIELNCSLLPSACSWHEKVSHSIPSQNSKIGNAPYPLIGFESKYFDVWLIWSDQQKENFKKIFLFAFSPNKGNDCFRIIIIASWDLRLLGLSLGVLLFYKSHFFCY